MLPENFPTLRSRLILAALAIGSVTLYVTVKDIRFVSAFYLLPLGLLFYFPATSDHLGNLAIIVAYLSYVAIGIALFLVRRHWFVAIYAIFCLILILGLHGCMAAFSGAIRIN